MHFVVGGEFYSMTRKIAYIIIYCVFALSLSGCIEQSEPTSKSKETELKPYEKNVSDKRNYEVSDSEIAEYLEYKYQDRSMYIAGLKIFEEFGTSNEGSVSIHQDENTLTFSIIKATGSVTGTIDGSLIYFKMNLDTNEIIEKKFKPAPNYAELGMIQFIEHSEEVIELTDNRLVEIGKYFKEMILKIEAN